MFIYIFMDLIYVRSFFILWNNLFISLLFFLHFPPSHCGMRILIFAFASSQPIIGSLAPRDPPLADDPYLVVTPALTAFCTCHRSISYFLLPHYCQFYNHISPTLLPILDINRRSSSNYPLFIKFTVISND